MTLEMITISPREAARLWIEETLRRHLHADLHPCGGADRFRRVAEAVEDESFRSGMPVEIAVELALEWCELQNQEAGLSYASHN